MTSHAPRLLTRLRLAERQVESSPQDWKSWEALYVAWAQIGEVKAAGVALRRCTSLAPATASIHVREIRFLLGTRDYEAALLAARTHVADSPASIEFLELGLEAGLACMAKDPVMVWSQALVRLDPSRSARAAHALARVGAFEEAAELLESYLIQCPEDSASHAVRAELHLWSGEDSRALDAARRSLTLAPETPLAQMVQAICLLQTGEPTAALAQLQSLAAHRQALPSPETAADPSTLWCWISMAHYALGELAQAVRAASRAMHGAGSPSLPAHILRMKMVMLQRMGQAAARRKHRPGVELDPLKRVNDIWSYRELLQRIEPLLEAPDRPWSGVQGDLQQAIDRALAELGGNLTPTPSRVNPTGTLPLPFQPPPSPRAEARQLQHLLRTRTLAEVLARFEDLQALHPDAITPHTYKGEVLLWFGRTAEARQQLQAAIDRDITTQWAWIGLGACALLEGQPEQAVETFQQGIEMCRFEGPTMFAYRAEAWLQMGEPERARTDIDTALQAKPQRISAWLLRALIDLSQGAGQWTPALFERLHFQSPHLCRAIKAEQREPDEALRVALRSMRGNRSSSLPFYFTDAEAPPAFLRWQARDWQSLLAQIDPLPPLTPQHWQESRPTECRRGNCGPRCDARSDLQAWIGPAVGVERWLHRTEASESLRAQALVHLTRLQAQRRTGCPDLPSLGAASRSLLEAIDQESLHSPPLGRLCELLRDHTCRTD